MQIFVSARGFIKLSKDHTQAVIRFGSFGTYSDRMLKHFACFVPLLLLPKGIAQIFERNQMIGAQAQRLLKIRNGFGGAAFSGREQSEIVPGIGQRLGIAGIESCGTLKAFSCFDNLVLFQIHAAQAVERLGTRRIIAKRALERRAGLFVIPTLKEN